MASTQRVVLVSGATRGIGREVVRQLLAEGHRVIATGRSADDLALVAEESSSTLLETAVVDLDSPHLERHVEEALGGRALDALIANAARFAPWEETATTADLDAARHVMETNLFGTWRLVRATLPSLRAGSDPLIVAVGSGSGSHGDPEFGLASRPGAVSYAVSKAALHALLRKLDAELTGGPVRVYAVDPGLTATAPGMADFGARPVEEGAASVLAPLRGDLPAGSLTRDGAPLPW